VPRTETLRTPNTTRVVFGSRTRGYDNAVMVQRKYGVFA
jgi:hypothetical protein